MNLSELFSKYLTEGKAPSGLKNKTIPLEVFLKNFIGGEDIDESEVEDFIRARQSNEVDTYGNPVGSKEKHKVKKDVPLIHRSMIIDDDGNPLSMEEIAKIISQRPSDIIGKNKKMEKSADGKSVFYKVSLPPLMGLYYDETAKELKMVKTCPGAGTCKQDCFARKGNAAQYKNASQFQSKVLTFLMNDFEGFKNQLLSEIIEVALKNNSKGIKTIIRWHDTGDFFRNDYLKMGMEIARKTEDIGVLHYAYTKSIGMVQGVEKPKNFVFNYSQGGISDSKIKAEDKGAIIVPDVLFQDLMTKHKAGWTFNSEADMEELKQRLSKEYNLENVIVYGEMMSKPIGDTPKWNVIVYPGNGDNSATRRDVVKTLLLKH
jgi:hypothetical protein